MRSWLALATLATSALLVAGTAHADAHLVGPNASALDCGLPINDGPLHLVAKAALRALVRWVSTGAPPPVAPRLQVDTDPSGTPQVRRERARARGARAPSFFYACGSGAEPLDTSPTSSRSSSVG